MLYIYCCNSIYYLSNKNINFIYKNQPLSSFSFDIVNITDSISKLTFWIDKNELSKLSDSNSDSIKSKYSITWLLYNSTETSKPLDSSTIYKTINSIDNIPDTGYFLFKPYLKGIYYIEIKIKDLLNQNTRIEYFSFQKQDRTEPEYYTITNKNNNQISKYNPVKKGNYKILYYDKTIDTLYVAFSPNKYNPALPPYVTQTISETITYDTTFILTKNDNNFFDINISEKGIYSISIYNQIKNCYTLTLKYYGDDYPNIKDYKSMATSLRYITKNEEYDKIINSQSIKLALDSFWLGIGGNYERAREIIKNYYSKIQDANKFFTSYKEGWKTDKGMIYIIYGYPHNVYKTNSKEIWIYGEQGNIGSLSFIFNKLNNSTSNNDYELERSSTYTNSWFIALESIRR